MWGAEHQESRTHPWGVVPHPPIAFLGKLRPREKAGLAPSIQPAHGGSFADGPPCTTGYSRLSTLIRQTEAPGLTPGHKPGGEGASLTDQKENQRFIIELETGTYKEEKSELGRSGGGRQRGPRSQLGLSPALRQQSMWPRRTVSERTGKGGSEEEGYGSWLQGGISGHPIMP